MLKIRKGEKIKYFVELAKASVRVEDVKNKKERICLKISRGEKEMSLELIFDC